MISIYIASPYSGCEDEGVLRQIDCADELMKLNFAPFVPLLAHYQHQVHPHGYETWMKFDFFWLKNCDAVLRLSGKSSGADREVEYAESLNIPVFYSIQELIEWRWKLYYKLEDIVFDFLLDYGNNSHISTEDIIDELKIDLVEISSMMCMIAEQYSVNFYDFYIDDISNKKIKTAGDLVNYIFEYFDIKKLNDLIG